MARCCVICLSIFGVILIALGLLGLFGFPPLFRHLVVKGSALTPGSSVYDDWATPGDIPLYMNYYFWEVQNVDDILNNGATPIVNQTGPLVYREVQNKQNLTNLNDSDATVYYLNDHQYIYDAERSAIAEDHNITVVNMIFWSTISSTNFLTKVVVKSFVNSDWTSTNESLKNAVSPFYTVTAADFLWGLYPNPLLVQLGQDPTSPLQYNNSFDGLYQVSTGADDMSTRAEIVSWDQSPNLTWWGTEYCNMINGTDGSIYWPYMDESDSRLYAYDTNTCRSVYFDRVNQNEDVQGIKTWRYEVPSTMFIYDDETACYCLEPYAPGCTNGTLDVSTCYEETIKQKTGASVTTSVVMTVPNMQYCESAQIDGIIGQNQTDPEKDATYIDVEPTSGVVVKARKRIQINTYLHNIKGYDPIKNFPPKGEYLLFPVFWVEEALDPSDSTINQLHTLTVLIPNVVNISSYCMIGLGGLFVIIALVCAISGDKNTYV